jgi:hypothetical protein
MTRFWIAVASADHVRTGRSGGFMQICHGKSAPLAKLHPGDGVVYYSPTETFAGKERLRTFTAIGRLKAGAPYQTDMGGGFHPFRRDVDWMRATAAWIVPLLPHLEFAAGKANWGAQFRYGLFSISARDFELIRSAMNAVDVYTVDASDYRRSA